MFAQGIRQSSLTGFRFGSYDNPIHPHLQSSLAISTIGFEKATLKELVEATLDISQNLAPMICSICATDTTDKQGAHISEAYACSVDCVNFPRFVIPININPDNGWAGARAWSRALVLISTSVKWIDIVSQLGVKVENGYSFIIQPSKITTLLLRKTYFHGRGWIVLSAKGKRKKTHFPGERGRNATKEKQSGDNMEMILVIWVSTITPPAVMILRHQQQYQRSAEFRKQKCLQWPKPGCISYAWES